MFQVSQNTKILWIYITNKQTYQRKIIIIIFITPQNKLVMLYHGSSAELVLVGVEPETLRFRDTHYTTAPQLIDYISSECLISLGTELCIVIALYIFIIFINDKQVHRSFYWPQRIARLIKQWESNESNEPNEIFDK